MSTAAGCRGGGVAVERIAEQALATSWLAPGSEVRLVVVTPADKRTAARLPLLTAT